VPFLLRLPRALHATLTERAAHEGLSLNEYCTRRLGAPEPPSVTRIDIGAIVEPAVRVAGGHFVGLIAHGSTVRGEASTSSDVDVLVVVDRGLPLTRDVYREWDIANHERRGSRLDAHFIHLPERPSRAASVWCEAAIEGVVLVDVDGRVEQTLREVRRAIGEGRLVRKRAHGQPYWAAA
jgi:hypothetical protein